MEITPLDINNEAACKEWDNFVDLKFKDTGHHHKTAYLKPIINSFQHQNHSILCRVKGAIVGVLPLIGIRSPIFGDKLSSIPYYNYGGALSLSKSIDEVLYCAAECTAKSENYACLQLRASTPLSSDLLKLGWFQQSHKANMVLELPDDMKKIGTGNAKKRAKLRSQAKLAERKAKDENIEVSQRFGGADLLDDFYSVFCVHMRDLGTPVFSKSFFEEVLKSIPSTITVVYWNKKPVSCGWLFRHSSERVSIIWASTLKTMNKYSLNTYMYHGILSFCVNLGVKKFDFGRSTIDAGTYKFKEQWGALPEQCFWYEWNKDGIEPDDSGQQGGKFALMVKVWKVMPLFLTNRLGPMLIKQTAG